MFTNNRNELRQVFIDVWLRMQNSEPMDAMQQVIARIIELHPEYHKLLSDESSTEQDFFAEHGQTNPFLHMSMHIALHEQISTNRPSGIQDCYKQIIVKQGSDHEAEHAMMECLGEALWLAQRNNTLPDENAYLQCLKKLAI